MAESSVLSHADELQLVRSWGELDVCSRGGQLVVRSTNPSLLDRIERCHRVEHPILPRLVSREALLEGEALGFDAEVACDMEQLTLALAGAGRAMGYTAALALGERIALGVAALGDAGLCQGALGWANFFVRTDGELIMLAGAAPSPERSIAVERAPEVMGGASPTPAADVYVVLQLLERTRTIALVPEVQSRVLRGDVDAGIADYAQAFATAHQRGFSVAPHSRHADLGRALAEFRELWRMTGHWPDPEALKTFLAEAIGVLTQAERPTLEVGPECRWLVLQSGERIDFGRSPVLRRIVRLLVDTHAAEPGRFVALRHVVRAGWPDHAPANGAAELGASQTALADRALAHNRAYVALSKLRSKLRRNLECRPLLETGDAGWRLSPEVRVTRH